MKEVDAKRVKTSSAAFFQYVDDHKQEYIDRLKDAVPPLQHRSRSPRSCISEARTAAPARTASRVYWACSGCNPIGQRGSSSPARLCPDGPEFQSAARGLRCVTANAPAATCQRNGRCRCPGPAAAAARDPGTLTAAHCRPVTAVLRTSGQIGAGTAAGDFGTLRH